jgi:rod shape-determining protein MreC
VAKVVRVERDPAYPFARIACVPLAGVDRHRTLLIVSGLPAMPPRPAAVDVRDLPIRNTKAPRRGAP